MNKTKNQKGAISLFVLLSMLFFLAFMIGTFSLVSRKNATQMQALKETQEIYKSGANGAVIYDSILSPEDTVIPIATKEQLAKVIEITSNDSSAKYMINGKMYTYTKDANYILQNDIILDLKEEVDGKNNITIYDYMLYSSKYNIDNNGHDIYYAQTDGSIWKCVCYQNMGTKTTDERKFSKDPGDYFYGKSYFADRYSILQDELGKYKSQWDGKECFELMLMYNSDNKKFDVDNAYNRWRQTTNPATENHSEETIQTCGYTIKYFSDDSIVYESAKKGIAGVDSYPVANTAFDGNYGINITETINVSECLFFVRVR